MNSENLARDVKIFHAIRPEQLLLIERHLQEHHFERGEWVVIEGTEADAMFIIRAGRIEVWKSGQGKRKGLLLGELKEGDCFGEMALIDCQKRSASVLAQTKLSLFSLPYRAMAQLYERDSKLFGLLIVNIAREISRRLRISDSTLLEFALPSIKPNPS